MSAVGAPRLAIFGAAASLIALWWFGPAAAAASTESPFSSVPVNAGAAGGSGDMLAAMLKVIFILAFIIGFFFLIMKVLARKKWNGHFGRSDFRTLGGIPLGPNKSVQLVEIGHTVYVLGVGEGVQVIDKIKDAQEVAHLLQSLSPDSREGARFGSGMREWMGKWKRGGQEQEDDNAISEAFQDVLQAKLMHRTGRKEMIEQMLRSDDRSERKVDP